MLGVQERIRTLISRRDLVRLARTVGPLAVLLAVQQVLYPAPWGVVADGALAGGRIALIAAGIALIYRANRILNFAQGDLGALPGAFAVLLVVSWHWNYWIGLVGGLAAAILLGVLVETLIMRRFSNSPRLVTTVATIGVAQILAAAALWLPTWWGHEGIGTELVPPFGTTIDFGGTTFDAHDILTALTVPLALGALALFLRRSLVGVAILGAAESPGRAGTLGVPVRMLNTVVWVVASVLAFLAMYLRAGVVGLPIGEVLSPLFLVQALAAATFGGFRRFGAIVAAAVGLGVLDRAILFTGRPEGFYLVVLFVVIIVGLFVAQRNGEGRVDADASAWQVTREVRPIPRELARLPEVRFARLGLWLVLAVFVLSLPAWLAPSRLDLATIIVIFGIVAASLVVLTGWAGQVSLGHVAFVGLGAVVAALLIDERGWDLGIALVVAGLAGAVTAVVVGFPVLRRRGGFTLAVSTLAFALMMAGYVLDRSISGDWLPGRRLDAPTFLGSIAIDTPERVFYLSVALLVLSLAMVRSLRHSRTGRVLIAIRENARASSAYGVNANRTTLAAFAVSGFLAAVAGGLYVVQQSGFHSVAYRPERSLELFSMVVIGGLGSLPGALLGTTYVQGAGFFFPGRWQMLATGGGLLLVLMVFPGGLGGVLADLRDGGLRWVARRRGLVVPSLLADVRVEDADAAGGRSDAEDKLPGSATGDGAGEAVLAGAPGVGAGGAPEVEVGEGVS